MKQNLKQRLLLVAKKLETITARPLERDPNREKIEAIEEAALEGAILIVDKLHELTGVPATPEAKDSLASKITQLLLCQIFLTLDLEKLSLGLMNIRRCLIDILSIFL
jgi:hypothetical protein